LFFKRAGDSLARFLVVAGLLHESDVRIVWTMNGAPAPDSPLARRVIPSPNHGERRGCEGPDMLLLHYTGMPDETDALRRLCDPASEVSAHYLIFEDGEVLQLVPEARRAWHAGASLWAGERDINSCSIGIEIANGGHDGGLPPFREAQIASVIVLARDILARWSIRPDRVLGHSDVAPGRKQDPGERFPWDRLHAAGIGHWVPPAPVQDGRTLRRGDRGLRVEALQAMFTLYGFGIPPSGVFDEETENVVTAFQRHFRPARIDGVADASTVKTLLHLIVARSG
jgi:N-acetylmuramoyl-L-alanine amidase